MGAVTVFINVVQVYEADCISPEFVLALHVKQDDWQRHGWDIAGASTAQPPPLLR